MKLGQRERHNLRLGMAFLAPNIVGFLAFTLVPLGFSLVLAFSNWDLQLHNMFKSEPLKFTGLDHFQRLLFEEQDFYRFLGNTLFFMIGIPFSIAGSLGAALLLSKDMGRPNRSPYGVLLAGAVLVSCSALLAAVGLGATAMTILLCGIAGGMLVMGALGGTTVYRTLFYLPHFTSGVAVYILWKKLYNPHTGPVNVLLSGPLRELGSVLQGVPAGAVQLGLWLCLGAMCVVLTMSLWHLGRMWRSGEMGGLAAVLPVLLLLLPVLFTLRWSPSLGASSSVGVLALATLVLVVTECWRRGQEFPATWGKGFGDALMFSLVVMVASSVLFGLGVVCHHLPGWAGDGLDPPNWLASYHWAKPAIMIMGLWGSIGSNNMLLYLAGISNVPAELHEAADIDGASRFQRFWHVTWPQLAPVTFFIVVMSVIGGLQGGFEMARTMTGGGPAGATTTLSYFIYNEGFETGRLGYASAVAWALFGMVFVVTMFNWKFGSRYVND